MKTYFKDYIKITKDKSVKKLLKILIEKRKEIID